MTKKQLAIVSHARTATYVGLRFAPKYNAILAAISFYDIHRNVGLSSCSPPKCSSPPNHLPIPTKMWLDTCTVPLPAISYSYRPGALSWLYVAGACTWCQRGHNPLWLQVIREFAKRMKSWRLRHKDSNIPRHTNGTGSPFPSAGPQSMYAL